MKKSVYILSNPSLPNLVKCEITNLSQEGLELEINKNKNLPYPFKLEYFREINDETIVSTLLAHKINPYRLNNGYYRLESVAAIEIFNNIIRIQNYLINKSLLNEFMFPPYFREISNQESDYLCKALRRIIDFFYLHPIGGAAPNTYSLCCLNSNAPIYFTVSKPSPSDDDYLLGDISIFNMILPYSKKYIKLHPEKSHERSMFYQIVNKYCSFLNEHKIPIDLKTTSKIVHLYREVMTLRFLLHKIFIKCNLCTEPKHDFSYFNYKDFSIIPLIYENRDGLKIASALVISLLEECLVKNNLEILTTYKEVTDPRNNKTIVYDEILILYEVLHNQEILLKEGIVRHK